VTLSGEDVPSATTSLHECTCFPDCAAPNLLGVFHQGLDAIDDSKLCGQCADPPPFPITLAMLCKVHFTYALSLWCSHPPRRAGAPMPILPFTANLRLRPRPQPSRYHVTPTCPGRGAAWLLDYRSSRDQPDRERHDPYADHRRRPLRRHHDANPDHRRRARPTARGSCRRRTRPRASSRKCSMLSTRSATPTDSPVCA